MILSALAVTVNSQDFDKDAYEEVLSLGILFYGAQRCGNTGNWLLSDNPYGSSCHMQDGPAYSTGTDLTGGWHDAGDYLKYTLTTAWSAYVLLKGYESFTESYADHDCTCYSGNPNGIPDVLDEVKIATDFLIKAHINDSTMATRVGGPQDHDLWVTSPYQSTLAEERGGGRRPVYAGARSDVWGISAAALALMSVMYRPFDRAYADTCLTHAETQFSMAVKYPGATEDPDDFYQKSEYKDDLMCGSIELYKAAHCDSLLALARSLSSTRGRTWWCPDWSNHWDMGRHSLVQAGDYSALQVWKSEVDGYMGHVSSKQYVSGLAYFGDWGSLRYACYAAFSAALLYHETGEEKYRNFAMSQVEYVMGENEYSRSFVVGWGENPPSHPHHANAYGYEAEDWDLSREPRYTLYGAMVGGPTRGSHGPTSPGYADDINDYVGNEVAISYNAGFAGALAMAVSVSESTGIYQDNAECARPGSVCLSVYPNPFNSTASIQFFMSRPAEAEIAFYDILGNRAGPAIQGDYGPGRHTVYFDAGDLASGVYVAVIKTGSAAETCKLMLVR